MKCADHTNGLDIKPEEFVTSAKNTYFIKELIGVGGYGAVYRVVQKDTNKEFALKAEKKLARREHTKLTMEVKINLKILMFIRCTFSKPWSQSRKKNLTLQEFMTVPKKKNSIIL